MLDNLTLTLTRLHIRLEDDFTAPERPFAVGLTLVRLTAHTTEEAGDEAHGGSGSSARASAASSSERTDAVRLALRCHTTA